MYSTEDCHISLLAVYRNHLNLNYTLSEWTHRAQWRIQELTLGGTHGKRAEREPITGVWGGAPSGVQGQSPWSVGQEGRSPTEAESL